MQASRITTELREALKRDDRPLTKISEKSGVPYHILYAFVSRERELSLANLERLHLFLKERPLFTITGE